MSACDDCSIWESDVEWADGWLFIKAMRIEEEVVSRGSRIEDGVLRRGGWGSVSGDKGVYNFIVVCTGRPKLSRQWFSTLASSHVVVSCCLILMSWSLCPAVLTVVGFCDSISMCPTVASLVNKFSARAIFGWWHCVVLELFDQRSHRRHLLPHQVDDCAVVFFFLAFCSDNITEVFSHFLDLLCCQTITVLF
jgi:hypothetical protein